MIEKTQTEIKNLKVEIKNLKNEIKKVKNKISTSKDKELKELFNYKLESKQKELSNKENSLKNKEQKLKDLKEIENLSYDEIIKKIENKELKLSKGTFEKIQIEKTHNDLKANKDIEIISPLFANQNGKKVERGYLIKENNNYYCIAINHIALKVTVNNKKMTFKFNNNHTKFYNTLCTCIIKESLYNLFEYLKVDKYLILNKYTKENKLDLKLFENSLNDIILKLCNTTIDIKNNTYTDNTFENITLENKKVQKLIDDLKY